MESHLNEQQIQRRESLNELRALGIEPFPAETFPVSHTAQEILDGFPNKPEDYQSVCIAGRLMTRRIMGKNGRKKVEQEFNQDVVCQLYFDAI